jgi:putative toxin-antitoxin system antitoxin component (TIGR02293 family)
MSKTISKESHKSSEGGRIKNTSDGREWRVRRESEGTTVKFYSGKVSTHFFSTEDKGELSYEEVKPLLGFLGYNQKEVATFLEVDPGTISRWKKSKNMIGQLRTKNLMDIDHIIAKGIRIFGSEENFSKWLYTANYALGDVAPIELLKDPYGVEQVEEAVDALIWGNYL